MKKDILYALFICALLLPLPRLFGSGSYPYPSAPAARPAPSHAGSHSSFVRPMLIDRERYYLGQKIFTGQTELPEKVISTELFAEQAKELTRFKERIPKAVPEETVAKLDAKKFAGKLEQKEYESLLYYFHIRYVIAALSR